MKCRVCPVTEGDCHGETVRPHLCALAEGGTPGALMLIRDVSGNNLPPPARPELPGLLATAAAFAGAVVRHVAAGMPQASDAVYAARLKVCETSGPGGSRCDKLILPEWRCGGMAGCGCYLKTKARWLDSKCPLEKW